MALQPFLDFMPVQLYNEIQYATEDTNMDQVVTTPEALGKALQRARKLQGLNQTIAGHAFKIDQTTVSSIEHGAPGTRLDTLFRMLAALDLELIVRSKPKEKMNIEDEWL